MNELSIPQPSSSSLRLSAMATAAGLSEPLIPGLPDELSLLILTSLPLSSHPNLSLVSRAWRSLLHSTSFFSLRSLLNHSQPCLCISLRVPTSPVPHSWYLVAPPCSIRRLPPPALPAVGSASTSRGPLLFLLGGSVCDLASRSLQIFDSRLGRWSLGPQMSVPRSFAAAAVVGHHLYVIGGCLPSSDPWTEVLDLDDLGAGWTTIPGPFLPHIRHRWMHGCAVLDGKVVAVADHGGVTFDTASRMWGSVPTVLDLGLTGRATVVGGLVCSYDNLGKIKGYDPVGDRWMVLEGLERSLPRFLAGASMANVGGKLSLVWEGKRNRMKEVELFFAEIELSREEAGRLRGAVVWSNSVVLPLPRGSTVAHCLALCL